MGRRRLGGQWACIASFQVRVSNAFAEIVQVLETFTLVLFVEFATSLRSVMLTCPDEVKMLLVE
jgi:hypothetical protein